MCTGTVLGTSNRSISTITLRERPLISVCGVLAYNCMPDYIFVIYTSYFTYFRPCNSYEVGSVIVTIL